MPEARRQRRLSGISRVGLHRHTRHNVATAPDAKNGLPENMK